MLLVLFTAILPIWVLASPDATDVPDPKTITLRSVDLEGDGCPPDSTKFKYAGNGINWSAYYAGFQANLWWNATAANAGRKICDATFDVGVPAGWQVTLDRVQSSYTASVRPGVRAWIESSFAISGNATEVSHDSGYWPAATGLLTVTKPVRHLVFRGPINGEGSSTFDYNSDGVYSECGKNTKLTLTNVFRLWLDNESIAQNNGSIPSESLTTLEEQRGFFAWRRC